MVAFKDMGGHVEVWPIPDDPIATARGMLKGRVGATEELRAAARRDEAHAEARRR